VPIMEVSVAPVPTLVLGATFAPENVMPSGEGCFIRRPRDHGRRCLRRAAFCAPGDTIRRPVRQRIGAIRRGRRPIPAAGCR
jgi:hypothetical protein